MIVCHSQGRSRPGRELGKYLRKLVAAHDPICLCKNMGTNESCVNDRDMWIWTDFCFETIPKWDLCEFLVSLHHLDILHIKL